jgi:shikimate kinase
MNPPPRQIRNVALIGFMGCGKSTVGQALARRLDFEFVDTDRLIEAQAGRTIPEIFAQEGEAAFRARERAVVESLAARERLVIATGGGVGAQPGLLEGLKRHALVVWLWASPETLWERCRQQTHRPLLQVPDPLARIRELLAAREPVYRRADLLINIEGRAQWQLVGQIAAEFQRRIAAAPSHEGAHPGPRD